MTDGKSFFRGGTEHSTRLSSFTNSSRMRNKGQTSLVRTSTEQRARSKPEARGKPKTTSSQAEQNVEPETDVTQNGDALEFTDTQEVKSRTSRHSSLPDGQTDRHTSHTSPRSSEKGDDLVFTERQLTRLATFLDDSLIKVPNHTKVIETTPVAPAPRKVKTFYVEKWPEPRVKLDNTISPYTRTVTRGQSSASKKKSLLGGEPITIETAKDLRMAVCGSTIHSLSMDWKKAGILFQNGDGPFPYGLVAPKNAGARGIVLAIQGHILQHLLFDVGADYTDLSNLRLSHGKCRSVAARALCDMWWRAGCGIEVVVCLPHESHVLPTQPGYREDGVTEKLRLFKFRSYEDLESFVKRYFDYFEGDLGCWLFLYSLILSRGFHRIAADQCLSKGGCEKLLTDLELCSFSLINLLITGSAVRFLHNGVTLYDEFGQLVVGSMLKTPKCPIWLTQVNGIMGVLFSTNPELVSHWRVEHRFQLYYYTGQVTQKERTCLSIDTRFNKRGRIKTALARRDTEDKAPPLETCILTKWYDADISWNGTTPFY